MSNKSFSAETAEKSLCFIKASGEGSRGGKIVGHTASGTPIYEGAIKHHLTHAAMHRKAADDHYKQIIGSHDWKANSAHNAKAQRHENASAKHIMEVKKLSDHMPEIPVATVAAPTERYYAKSGRSDIIIDLKKADRAGSHKYLRKYQRGGKTIYVYKDTKGKARNIKEGAVDTIRKLAGLGDEHAKKVHDTLHEVPAQRLKILRELARLGDKDAQKHLKHEYAIDWDAEKLEEQLVGKPEPAVDRDDPIHKVLDDDKRRAIINRIKAVVKGDVFDHLARHQGTDQYKNLKNAGVTADSVTAGILHQKTPHDILAHLSVGMKKIQAAHKGLRHANSSAQNVGGYGNMAYQKAIKIMEEEQNVLPSGYGSIHKTPGETPPPAKEIAERLARAKIELAERERRELGELKDSAAYYMASMASGIPSGGRTKWIKDLDASIKGIFGRSLKKNEFPYDFEGHKLEIRSVSPGIGNIRMEMTLRDADGNQVTDGWTREWSNRGGRPHIENAYLVIKESARGGARIGQQINSNQRALMRSIDGGGTIGVHANISVGGYTWCNQGFTFNAALRRFRTSFRTRLAQHGVNLSSSDMQAFEEPCHFAAFSDGKMYAHQDGMRKKLTPEQKASGSLSGVAGDLPLTESEKRGGITHRMAVNLGKKLMLGTDWSGTWDSKKDTEASRYAESYQQSREAAFSGLSDNYKNLLAKVKSGSRVGAIPEPVRPSLPTGIHPGATRAINAWKRGPGNIRMTSNRRRWLAYQGEDAVNDFLRHAPLTSAARAKIRSEQRLRRVRG